MIQRFSKVEDIVVELAHPFKEAKTVLILTNEHGYNEIMSFIKQHGRLAKISTHIIIDHAIELDGGWTEQMTSKYLLIRIPSKSKKTNGIKVVPI